MSMDACLVCNTVETQPRPEMFSYLVLISPMVPTQVKCVVEVDTLKTNLLLHNWHKQQISKIK